MYVCMCVCNWHKYNGEWVSSLKQRVRMSESLLKFMCHYVGVCMGLKY